ncbi:MAG TPA: hypothetical protein VKZ95_03950, partial [Sphingobacteriaceae bacterium]|nr:hypothetical protein [Sphingobacteriaceae bacterium]
KAGDSALANYTNINPSEPRVFAVDNTTFKLIKKNNETNLFNKYDGRYNLQVWKYAPEFINTIKPSEYTYDNVDPISLYLTYKGDQDERVQMELENLIKKQIW